jgi:hypothetical protein
VVSSDEANAETFWQVTSWDEDQYKGRESRPMEAADRRRILTSRTKGGCGRILVQLERRCCQAIDETSLPERLGVGTVEEDTRSSSSADKCHTQNFLFWVVHEKH